jgi:cation/acetate symporter
MPLDGQAATASGSSTAAGSGVFALLAVAILAVAAAAGFGAARIWGVGGYWAAGIVIAAAVSLVASVRRLGDAAAPIAGGMSLATGALGGTFVLAVPAAIFAMGHDGLSYPLGLGAGILLMQLATAPRFAQSGARSLPDLISTRFPGRVVALLSVAIITASMVALLVAGLTAAGIVGMRLLGVDFASAVLGAACAALACFVVRGTGATSTANGLLYPLLLIAAAVPVVMLSAQWHGLPVPQLAYANALWQLQGLEENLLEQELADPSFMKPMLTAFVSLTPINFVGIVLGLATGIAVLPSLLAAPLAAASSRVARHTALWALAFGALLLTLAPAIASYARQEFAELIGNRTALSALPAWVFTYGKLGLVHICGHAATSSAVVAQACAAEPDGATSLRLQDVTLTPDAVVLALPEIAGIDAMLMGAIAIAVLATVVATAYAPLNVVVQALGLGGDRKTDEPARAERLLSYLTAAAVVAASVALAILRPAGIIDIATWGIVVAAAGLFPAVIAALWMPRANSWGVAAGMLAGVGVLAGYLIAARYFAVPFFEATSVLSSGGEPGWQYFDELRDAWLSADAGPAKDAAWAALDAHAQSVADWFGIRGAAAVMLALPAGLLALLLVSLVTPTPRPAKTAP